MIYSHQKERIDEPKIDISRIKKEFNFKPTNNFNKFIVEIICVYEMQKISHHLGYLACNLNYIFKRHNRITDKLKQSLKHMLFL